MTLRWLCRAATAGAVASAALALGVPQALAASTGPAAGVPVGAPASLLVRTVPPIPGARVSFDGRTFLAGPQGAMKIITVSGRHRIAILPPRSEPAGTTARFARWLDGLALISRKITLSPGTNHQQAGFVVSHPVAVRFTDPEGHHVPLSDVTRITVASSLGQRYTFPPASPPSSLPANRIVRNQAGLVPLATRYSVREVVIGGSNVVYGGSQNFFVHPSGTWTVRVLLFPLRVEVSDALFGFATGRAVRLTLPDGSSRIIPLGPGHAVTVTGLPRATYQLAAKGPGLGLSAQSALSKPQVAKVLLLSWLDVLAVLAFAVLFLIGLPVLGGRIVRRPHGMRLPTWHVGRVQRHPTRTAEGADSSGITDDADTLADGAGTPTAGDTGQPLPGGETHQEPAAGGAEPAPEAGGTEPAPEAGDTEPAPAAVPALERTQ